QLGNNSTTTAMIATRITTIQSLVEVVAGDKHSCARKSDNTLWCWGYNANGQLGNNTISDSHSPVQVPPPGMGATGWLEVSAGTSHTCAIDNRNNAWCWGLNMNGELGNNMTTDSHVPVQVSGAGTWTAIAAGGAHSCGIKGGNVWCWGKNMNGQLGNNMTMDSHVPVEVQVSGGTALASAVAVAVGNSHSCALKSDNSVWCWGAGSNGQLGNNGTSDSHFAVQVQTGGGANPPMLGTVTAIALGNLHSCGLKGDGTAWCWGDNTNGACGNSGGKTTAIATQVGTGGTLLTNVTTLTAGGSHSCASTANQTTMCWGLDSSYQLGNNSTSTVKLPVSVLQTASPATPLGCPGL
ncbi:MAG: RCC1 domain-containing protein, partial [Acidobacteriota bacterium]